MTQTDHDLIIIGGGPAGLAAGLNAARARLDVVLVEKVSPGGQVLTTDWIENYPGFVEGLSGADLVDKLTAQAKRFDLPVVSGEVERLETGTAVHQVHLADRTLRARSVIIATGASPRRLGVPGEAEFFGKGVSTCATCDAPFYRDRVVAAVGGGDTAVQESLYLTRFARKVYLIHRRDRLRATAILQERALAEPKIEILWDTVVRSMSGLFSVEKITIENVKSGSQRELEVDGCFVWVGIRPNAGFIDASLAVDPWGFIKVDAAMQTSVAGVFVAGDVRETPLRQIATAVGDAAIAASSAEQYLAGTQ